MRGEVMAEIVALAPLAMLASLGLTAFAVGLETSRDDVAAATRRPAKRLRSLAAVQVAMPLLALVLAHGFDFDVRVRLTMVALALTTLPPVLPPSRIRDGLDIANASGLHAVAAVASVALTPIGLALVRRLPGGAVGLAPLTTVIVVAAGVLAPLAAGFAARAFAPVFAARIVRPAAVVATALLLAAFLPILFARWPELIAVVRDGTLVALAIFTLAGLAVGHLLGGPDPDERAALAVIGCTRHPGVALAVAGSILPEPSPLAAVLLWQLVLGALVVGPYLEWRSRRQGAG